MTNHVVRLYVTAAALLAFFLSWSAIAARPWVETTSDPRLAALEQRERRLLRDATLVQQVVDRRWAAYRAALARANEPTTVPAAASIRVVRIVSSAPVVKTRSS